MSQLAADVAQSIGVAPTSHMPDPSVMVIFGASGDDLTSAQAGPRPLLSLPRGHAAGGLLGGWWCALFF